MALVGFAAASPQGAPGGGAGTSAVARERARADLAIERFASASDAELRRQYDVQRPERRLAYRAYDRDLMLAFRRVLRQGGDADRATVERAIRATLGNLADRTPSELASRITLDGAANPVNLDLRDAALHLAMLARLTGDPAHARRSAALLERFAEVVPRWPIWNPYHVAQAEKKAFRQDDPKAFAEYTAAGLWGAWIHDDLIMGVPLLEAYALLEPTGAVDRPKAQEAIQRLFRLHLETQDKFDPKAGYSNQEIFRIQGLMEFGRLLRDPELVHEGVRRYINLMRVGFFPDGWWREGATSYHTVLQRHLRHTADTMLVGYSDPVGFRSRVDGTRFDDLDLAAHVRGQLERIEAATDRLVLPDGNLLAVHDTEWPAAAGNRARPPARSHLFGAMGQGSLIAGRAGDDSYTRATLHWGQDAGHAHRDSLNLNLWAKGTEAISETAYRPIKGSNSTREWHTSTAGHVTVVVDGADQFPTGPRGNHQRKLGPEDAIPDIPDWRWRERWSYEDGGDLRLFGVRFPQVQVIEADATRAYDMVTGITMYRRTIALVHIDPPGTPNCDFYVADVFRVRGAPGRSHTFDWMLHGSLQLDQQVKLSVPLEPVRDTKPPNPMLRDLRRGETASPWLAAFEMANGVTLLTFMAPDPAGGTTEVFEADAPAMRRNADAPFVFARRTGDETVFVAVHHVVRGRTSRVRGLEILPAECPGCVAFRVDLGNRTDTLVSCEERSSLCRVPGGIEVRGLFAHVAEGESPESNWAMLFDGDLLRTPSALIEGDTASEGVVRGTLRKEAGDRVDGFIVDEALPTGDALAGCAVIIDQAGEMSWSYEVRAAESVDGRTVIETTGETGLIVEPAGAGRPGLVKQTYYPCWGFRGEARYRVPGDAMAKPLPAGQRDAPPTGRARVSWNGGAPGAK